MSVRPRADAAGPRYTLQRHPSVQPFGRGGRCTPTAEPSIPWGEACVDGCLSPNKPLPHKERRGTAGDSLKVQLKKHCSPLS